MTRSRWILYALVGLLALSLLWGASQARARRQVELSLEAERQRAFSNLADNVANVEVLLGKGLVLSSALQSATVFPDIWYQANMALANLSRLPLPIIELQKSSRFLNQAADLAYSLGKKVARGGTISDKDWEIMNNLRDQAAKLGGQIKDLEISSLKQGLTWSSMRGAAAARVTGANLNVGDRFKGIEKEMERYPSLVYDGPFSDHIERRQPAGVTGNPITADEAIARALKFAPTPAGVSYAARVKNEVAGKIPGFSLEVVPQGTPEARNSPSFNIDISRTGGHVVWMTSSRVPRSGNLPLEQARQRAVEFLQSRGYASMEPTYAVKENGSAYVLFAYKQDGVRIYSDLIKVQVALDTGEVTGFDSLGYLMSHRQRTIPKPRISAEKASQRISPRLKVSQCRLALIPLENLDEVLAYEFRTRLGATDYLVYVNALTGDEERIMQLVPAGEGELAM
ncbi:MAG: germination protein YpeB [Firmicutes bacterium]|nr:germination protein YpeB [Bacillota bacterium]